MSDRLTISIGGGSAHEVDSITDCKNGYRGQSIEQMRIQLEMCCHCHKGRPLWLSYKQVMSDGNKALQNLLKQTVEMMQQGLEIRSNSPERVTKVESDNFSMNDDDDEP